MLKDAEAVIVARALRQQLLTSSRKHMLRPQPIDLGVAIREMSPLLRQACGDGVEFGLHTEDRPFHVSIDVEQLRAALLNLVINARDAMGAGGRLDIALANVAEAGVQLVEIVVHDVGTGIAAEHLSKVTDPFFSTKPLGLGSGLGNNRAVRYRSRVSWARVPR
jgi:signal transduction histidine kinase